MNKGSIAAESHWELHMRVVFIKLNWVGKSSGLFLCMCFCLWVRMHHVIDVCKGQKRISDAPDLETQVAVGTWYGNWGMGTWVLCKSSKCPVSHIPRPYNTFQSTEFNTLRFFAWYIFTEVESHHAFPFPHWRGTINYCNTVSVIILVPHVAKWKYDCPVCGWQNYW